MKTKTFSSITQIFGIIIASLLVLILVSHMVGYIADHGMEAIKDSAGALINWYDNPTGLFTSFIIGYACIWWKKLLGAIILISAALLATLINLDNLGWLIFTGPIFSVGLMYLFNWHLNKIIITSNS